MNLFSFINIADMNVHVYMRTTMFMLYVRLCRLAVNILVFTLHQHCLYLGQGKACLEGFASRHVE